VTARRSALDDLFDDLLGPTARMETDRLSQTFAGPSQTTNGPQSEHWRGSSRNSQLSQGGEPTSDGVFLKEGRKTTPKGACEGMDPCESCESRESPALARVPGQSVPCEGSAKVAKDAPATSASPQAVRFRDVRAKLLRWGWPEPEAETTARRIAEREALDTRRTCPECAHYRPGRCGNARAAGLHSPDLGRELASLPQRCPAFKGLPNE